MGINRIMLTEKQEKFVQELVKGKSQRAAYREAYPSSKEWLDTTVDSKACVLFKNEKVMARYKEMTEGAKAKAQDDAESMRAFIIETYKKIASGELCEETKEYDGDGNLTKVKKSVKPSDVNNAIAKLAEYYQVAPVVNENTEITVTLRGLEEYAD